MIERIKNLLPEQYKESVNFNKLFEVLLEPAIELKTVFANIKNLLNIEDQSGDQLDLIGEIIVQKREGLNDSDYRKLLRFKIKKNTSKATLTDIVEILKFLTNATKVVYSDNPPASYTIYTNGQTIPTNLLIEIDRLSAAGVSVLIYASVGDIPFIATELITNQVNVTTEDGVDVYDEDANQVAANIGGNPSNKLQIIFEGAGFGAVEVVQLSTEDGQLVFTEDGEQVGAYDENQNIIGSAKANISFQSS